MKLEQPLSTLSYVFDVLRIKPYVYLRAGLD